MNENKPILSIETSGSVCGVSVYYSDVKHFDIHINSKLSHSKKIFSAIDDVLKISDTKLEGLKWIAVSAGPGSFTGLRIGLSAAKGLCFGADIPLLMVPTYQAIALQTSELYDDESSFIIANKVNMDEVYYAEFSINKNSFIFAEDLKIIKKNELNSRISNKNIISNITDFKNNFSWLSSPAPFYIAKWSSDYGSEKVTNTFETIEPLYYKEFIPIKR